MNSISEADELKDADKPEIVCVKNEANLALLKYGNDKELIFNIDALIEHVLFHFMRVFEENEYPLKTEVFDLIDTEGALVNLRLASMRNKYASTVLKSRSMYILIDAQEFPILTPLLKNSDLLTDELAETLKKIAETEKLNIPPPVVYEEPVTESKSKPSINVLPASTGKQSVEMKKKKKSKGGQNK